jgi:hypothetical protein
VVAGVAAGALLAVLFYFYDLGQASPLGTPAFLYGALTGQENTAPTLAVVATFTVLHFLAWAALGVLAAALIEYLGLARSLLVGAAYGLFACSLVFYAGLIISGSELLSAPGWPAVFFGNTLSGIAMFAVLHWLSTDAEAPDFIGFLRPHRALRHGITAGLLGAVTVAVWFLILDTLLREPLYTPAALATVVLEGGGGPADVTITAGRVVGYTILHFAFFMLAGLLLDGMTEQVQRFPPLIFGLLILFVVYETLFVALVAILGAWVLSAIAWWSVLVGNLLAAVAMGLYMWRAHPGLAEKLTSEALWSG